MADGDGLMSVDYEVHGKVQGVFFRKYTQVRAAVPGGGLPCLPACAAPAVSPLSLRALEGPSRGRAGSWPRPRSELRPLLEAVDTAVLLAARPRYVSMTEG